MARKPKDISGQRFGKLIAIENTGNKQSGHYLWSCKCDCGNETIVTLNNLNKGNTKSCGCQAVNTLYKAKDITGRRFGRLIAINDTGEKTKTCIHLWLCKCDCGNVKVASVSSLINGVVESCGCKRSEVSKENIKKVHKILHEYDYVEKTQLSQLTSDPPKNNTSGVRGVRWNEERRLWHSYIWFKGNFIFSDFFTNEQDAIDARKEAEDKYFKPILEKYDKSDNLEVIK